MSDIDPARALVRMARKDFTALRGMLPAATFAEEIFGFHAQQAAEKAMKAWLAANGVPYPLTHDLTLLLDLLESAGEAIDDFLALSRFNVFAVQARYDEHFLSSETAMDRPAVIAEVEALLLRVEAKCGV